MMSPLSRPFRFGLATLTLSLALLAAAAPGAQRRDTAIPRWGVFEAAFTSARPPDNPLQDIELRASFTAPSGRTQTVRGFWDGGATWRVRFSPDEVGNWSYATSAMPGPDPGLDAQKGSFRVVSSRGSTRLDRHGPVRVSRTRTFLEHSDGTPFFWLADTGWNAALLSSADEWRHYIGQRVRQRFTAVQWVTTQWRASP